MNMSVRIFALVLALVLGLMLSACGGGGAAGSPALGGGSGIALFTTAGSSVSLDVGKSYEFSISGGKPPYSVSSSNPSSALAVLKTETAVTVNGLKGGTATLTVKDAAGAEKAVAVEVKAIPLSTSAPSALVIGIGSSPSYTIGGGTGPFEVTSSNELAAKTVVIGRSFSVFGVAAGTATVLITDASRTSVPLAVTVAQAGVQELRVSPVAATANVGDVLAFAVNGGTRPYEFLVNNPSVVVLTSDSPDSSPATFRMERVGTTAVVIKDAAGQFGELSLTVTPATSNQLRLSPSTLQLPETYQLGAPGASTNIALRAYGAVEPITVYTTDPQRAEVIAIGTTVYLYQGLAGTLCSDAFVTRYTLAPTPVTDPTQPATQAFDLVVTVVDALGASATAKLVIIDDGLNLNPMGNCR